MGDERYDEAIMALRDTAIELNDAKMLCRQKDKRIATLESQLAEAERTIAELLAKRAVEMKVDWAEGESGPSAWVPSRIAEELELQNAKLRSERDEARRVASGFVERCLDSAFQEAHDRNILDRAYQERRTWKHIRRFAIDAALRQAKGEG